MTPYNDIFALDQKGLNHSQIERELGVFCKRFLEKSAKLFGEYCISKMEKVAGTFRSESFAF
jgi:hypothetical protein